jgi:2-polyprenyl-3-methyl-5-hydroxy-6-metoxy-1,4-benzoquinol methylase
MLDAGCGQGRFLSRYCSLFTTCVGIDADPLRLKSSQAAVKHINAEFHLSGAHDYKASLKFDFIINSMVIQHVSLSLAAGIVRNLVQQLKREGILVITTTFYPIDPFYQYMCVSADPKSCDNKRPYAITQQQFENLVAKPIVRYTMLMLLTM